MVSRGGGKDWGRAHLGGREKKIFRRSTILKDEEIKAAIGQWEQQFETRIKDLRDTLNYVCKRIERLSKGMPPQEPVPCPVCGKQPSRVRSLYDSWYIRCEEYEGETTHRVTGGVKPTEEEAIYNWNTHYKSQE